MFIFLIYSLNLCCGNVSNSNVTIKFAQLHYFYHKILGETKDIMSPPVQKLGGHVPPINSVPGHHHSQVHSGLEWWRLTELQLWIK